MVKLCAVLLSAIADFKPKVAISSFTFVSLYVVTCWVTLPEESLALANVPVVTALVGIPVKSSEDTTLDLAWRKFNATDEGKAWMKKFIAEQKDTKFTAINF